MVANVCKHLCKKKTSNSAGFRWQRWIFDLPENLFLDGLDCQCRRYGVKYPSPEAGQKKRIRLHPLDIYWCSSWTPQFFSSVLLEVRTALLFLFYLFYLFCTFFFYGFLAFNCTTLIPLSELVGALDRWFFFLDPDDLHSKVLHRRLLYLAP